VNSGRAGAGDDEPIGTSLQALSHEWGDAVPQIQCIAVNQSTGSPGGWISEFIGDTREFAKLNAKQIHVLVDGALARRRHTTLDRRTPDAVYLGETNMSHAA